MAIWAYLWGIETLLLNFQLVNIGWGFEPTYEELKLLPFSFILILLSRIWAYLWGIETPWIFKTPSNLHLIWAYLWGIETIHWSPPEILLEGDLSLPMRNWNYKESLLFEILSEDLSLPMRNWNDICPPRNRYYRGGFEPTYEELKLN